MAIIHERADGGKIEYRVAPVQPLFGMEFEYRRLRRDGTAYKEFWHRVLDGQLARLHRSGTGIIEALCDPAPWQPEGYVR